MVPIIYADLIDDAGNLARFEEIYEEYYQQMFFKAKQVLKDEYEAEDAVHDAFIGIARNMKTISAIANKQDLFYYLMRAAENAAYNRIRQTKHYTAAVPLQDAPFVSDRSFWDTVCMQMDYARLVQLISDLPKIYREVLYYHFVMEIPIPEVARSLDIKLATAKQRLVRGKKQLLQMIEQERSLYYGND